MFSFIHNNKKNPNSLGIDIGTKSIRITEFSRQGEKNFLENYGEMNLDIAGAKTFRWFDQNTLNPDIKNISAAIAVILEEAGIVSEKAVFSLPDFSTFFINFELPPMNRKEIDNAIMFEARKYIPLPMNDIFIDSEIISTNDTTKGNNEILVMAIPKMVIDQYKIIADSCGLELSALEAEVIGLKRALMKNGDPISCLVEIGYQSTNISMVENGYVKSSISYDVAGKDMTFAIAEALEIEVSIAEEMKKNKGLSKDSPEIVDALVPVLAIICDKIKKVIKDFEVKEGKKVEKILLSGGGSRMDGILNFFRIIFGEDAYFKKTHILIGDAFYKTAYDPRLESKIRDINSYFSIAIGEGLRKFEK